MRIEFKRHVKVALLVSVFIFLIMTLISYFLGADIKFDKTFLVRFLYYLMYGLSFYTVNMLVVVWFEKKHGKNHYTRRRILQTFFTSLGCSLITIFLLRIVEDVIIEGEPLQEFLKNETFGNYLVPFVIVVVVLLGFNVFYISRALSQKKIKEQKIIAGTANAKFESLKNQLDPHFLFNSLNVLTSLIEEDTSKAQNFTTSLSKVYRYVLEQKDKDLVSLEEELKFAKTYMSLLKMRFENAIEFTIPNQVNNPEAKVVPLSLQLLLENCIKHNIVSEKQPLHIAIEEKNNQLIVKNNFQPKQVLKKSSGVGLQNIKQRYQILSTRELFIHQSEQEFVIQLPLLTKKSSVMNRTENTKADQYLRARKKVDALKDLYGSLLAFVIVIPILILINIKTYSGVKWFWFPMIGWGIGLAFQAYEVYGKDRYFGKAWEDRKIKEFMKDEDPTTTWE